jgi:hypothetical protein
MEAAYIVPPPRRRASPSAKTIGGVFSHRSIRSAPIPPVANPSFHGSKGEGQPPARGRGPCGRKKRKHPCLRFFPFRAASCRPRLHATTSGRSSPARMFGFTTSHANFAPRLTQVTLPCQPIPFPLRPSSLTQRSVQSPQPRHRRSCGPADGGPCQAPPRAGAMRRPRPPPLRGDGPAPSGGGLPLSVATCTLIPQFCLFIYITLMY